MKKKILDDGKRLNLFQCGGSVINPYVILTAAHCVSEFTTDNFVIRAGEWDVKTTLEPLPYQDRFVAQIVVHPSFEKATLKNDLALLFLENPLNFVENVQAICLPPSNLNFDLSRCFATGWGKDKHGLQGKHQTVLKKLELPVIPNNECQEALKTTRLSKYFQLHSSFLCAGGQEGFDTCKGDGGSPLVCPIIGTNTNQYYLAGVVSWGIGCGLNNIPGIYVKVSEFRNWIDETVTDKGLNISSYVHKLQYN